MAGRILGTVGYIGRNCVTNRSGLLRCCSVDYDKIYPLDTRPCRKAPVIISRNFFDAPARISTSIFRYLAESEITAYTRDVFTYVHTATGLPWWATILVSGVALKVVMFPLRVYQLKLLGRLQSINIEELTKSSLKVVMQKKKKYQWPEEKAKRALRSMVRRERKALIEKYNCHPFKIILVGYLELPAWLYMSIAWRTMSYGFSDNVTDSNILTTQMMTEGLFWCSNLTLPDPLYILPALVFIGHMMHVELGLIQADLLKKKRTMFFKVLTGLNRVFGVIATLFCSTLPATVGLFWASSTGITLVRDYVLISPAVRRALKLPYEPITQRDVLLAFKKKFLPMGTKDALQKS